MTVALENTAKVHFYVTNLFLPYRAHILRTTTKIK